MIEELRKKIPGEEFDYQSLLDGLKEYSRPRDKITKLLRQKAIIRVKKGIYIFGERYAQRLFSREILANMIYGPSYLSLDYALHFHGLIPERIETVTSVTLGRSRRFSTPVGLFTYRQIPIKAYHIGIDLVELDQDRHFLMAIPEKALADKIQSERRLKLRSQAGLREFLLTNLRIDPGGLVNMNAQTLAQIAAGYESRKLNLLSDFVKRLGEKVEV
ncbi:MAG: hypothetical protein HY787_25215 [Deltaproteobacteria bacterium]|nr:hypothetical protein [Deltaproteobacteria bacterium]